MAMNSSEEFMARAGNAFTKVLEKYSSPGPKVAHELSSAIPKTPCTSKPRGSEGDKDTASSNQPLAAEPKTSSSKKSRVTWDSAPPRAYSASSVESWTSDDESPKLVSDWDAELSPISSHSGFIASDNSSREASSKGTQAKAEKPRKTLTFKNHAVIDETPTRAKKDGENVWAAKAEARKANEEDAARKAIEELHRSRGPAPARFLEPIKDAAMTIALAGEKTLPKLSSQLDEKLAPEFQKLKPVVYRFPQHKKREEIQAQQRKFWEREEKVIRASEWAAQVRCALEGKGQDPGSQLLIDRVEPEELSEYIRGLKARAQNKIARSESNEAQAGEDAPQTQITQKQGPISRLQELQYKSAGFMKLVNPTIERDFEAYEAEPHGGITVQLSDHGSAIIDNISDLGERPEDWKTNDRTTIQKAYRWEWFIRATESLATRSESERSREVIGLEKCDFDPHLVSPYSDEVVQSTPTIIHPRFGKWIEGAVFTASHRPFEVDTATEAFRNGTSHNSGMRRKYIEYPPDSFFPPNRPEFDRIEYPKTKSPDDDFSRNPLRRCQTSDACLKAVLAEWDAETRAVSKDVLKLPRAKKIEKYVKAIQEQHYFPERYNPNVARLEPTNTWIPEANIFIRQAKQKDVDQIAKIYDWYIKESCMAIETSELPEDHWQGIFDHMKESEQPFLVAVSKNRKKNKRAGMNSNRDTILGFACCQIYGGESTSLKGTQEIFVWVHHDHQGHGIGKSLLDRYIACFDSTYRSHRGTDFSYPSKEQVMYNGGFTRTLNVVACLYHDVKEPGDFVWKKKWLESFGFFQTGCFPGAAEKFNKRLTMSCFMRPSKSHSGNLRELGFTEDLGFGDRDRSGEEDKMSQAQKA